MGTVWCRLDLSSESLWAVDEASQQTHSSFRELMQINVREMLPEQGRRAVGPSALAGSTTKEQQSNFGRS